jgi:xanthine dehydrogenase YagS FAD-binding subunit
VKAFAYVNAANEKEALAALVPERGRTLPLAGGQDLLALMKDYVARPDRIVNVKTLDATVATAGDGGLRIGSAVTLAALAAHEGARKAYPALTYAAQEVGTPQIRHVGTVGGNLCQRPRCWYFRNEEFHCLKKGGPRCYAVEGENQFHAIFGEGPCHIVHPSSLAVPLIAYNARMRVAGQNGEREVPAEEFFVMPDQSMFAENVLRPNELLTHVILPPPGNVKSATYEVRYKQSHDWPLAFATAVLSFEGRTVTGARLVLGAVAPVPWRVREAERELTGKTINEVVADRVAQVAVSSARPMSQNAYKVQIARTALKRCILAAAAQGAATAE